MVYVWHAGRNLFRGCLNGVGIVAGWRRHILSFATSRLRTCSRSPSCARGSASDLHDLDAAHLEPLVKRDEPIGGLCHSRTEREDRQVAVLDRIADRELTVNWLGFVFALT